MEILWLDKKEKYDGSQLSPLKNYLVHGLLGDSIVGWQGSCDVTLDHMMDGEDLREKSSIAGDDMLHFVLEVFDFPLTAAVSFQRLMGEILISLIEEKTGSKGQLIRKGDDLYWEDKKFNISIATCSSTSSLIHFGFNIKNQGTPVKTCALEDFGVNTPAELAKAFMSQVQKELLHIKRATKKVRSF